MTLVEHMGPIVEANALSADNDITHMMYGAARTVFVVDGSREWRLVLSRVLRSADCLVRPFGSAEAFLAAQSVKSSGCVVLNTSLPGMSGLELQHSLTHLPNPRPIVFLSDPCAIRTSVEAMKAGAVDFLTKPCDDSRLLRAVVQALERDADERRRRAIRSIIQQRVAELTSREHQVMTRVVCGRLNKQIAAELGTGVKTVKVHRARMMSKMQVRSVAELVQLAARVGINMEPALGAGPRPPELGVMGAAKTQAPRVNPMYLNHLLRFNRPFSNPLGHGVSQHGKAE
jgi:FixJ family two-component response regulator